MYSSHHSGGISVRDLDHKSCSIPQDRLVRWAISSTLHYVHVSCGLDYLWIPTHPIPFPAIAGNSSAVGAPRSAAACGINGDSASDKKPKVEMNVLSWLCLRASLRIQGVTLLNSSINVV